MSKDIYLSIFLRQMEATDSVYYPSINQISFATHTVLKGREYLSVIIHQIFLLVHDWSKCIM